MKLLYAFIILNTLAFINIAKAQSLYYPLNSSSGTFTQLTGATTLSLSGGSVNDGWYNSIPIGFYFFYNASMYTSVSASTNGWLTFGTTLLNSTPANDLANNGTRPVIAPLWDDLNMALGSVSYITTGTAPSRVFTIQWLNAEWDWFAGTPVISFQVKLFETTGKVEFVYRQESGSVNNGSASIGISGASTGSFWSLISTTNSNTISSGTISTTTLNTKPATGQIYDFTPAVPSNAPTNLAFNTITSSSMNITWYDVATNEQGYAIFISTDGINYTYSTTRPINSTSCAQLGLTPSTTYYWKVYAITDGCMSAALSGTQATTAGVAGVITVPGTYPNLTMALNALKTSGISGNVVIELQNSYTSASEIFPIRLTSQLTTSSNKTLTIRPASNVTATLNITCTLANTNTIEIDSFAKYIYFDGRPGGTGTNKRLSINSTSYSSLFINGDVGYDTIRYCILASTGGSSYSFISVVTIDNDYRFSSGLYNISLENCDVKNNGNFPSYLINVFSGQYFVYSSQYAYGLNISNNNLYNFFTDGMRSSAVQIGGILSGCSVLNNNIYQTSSNTSLTTGSIQAGIAVNANVTGSSGIDISNNNIGGTGPGVSGSYYSFGPVSLSNIFVGISVGVTGTSLCNIQNNHIGGILLATTPAQRYNWYGNTLSYTTFTGIEVISGNVNVGNIIGNIIGSVTANSSIYILSEGTTNSENIGINYMGSGIVANNIIAGIRVDGSAANNPNSFTAIKVNSPTATVSGNIIGNSSLQNSINAANTSTSSSGQFVKGISGNALAITNNTISNLNNNYMGSAASGLIYGIETTPSISSSVTGNIIKNLSTSSANTGVGNNASLIGISMATTASGQTISQNIIDSFVSTDISNSISITGIYYNGSNISGNNISRNFIHSLSINSSNALAQICGIYLNAGVLDVTNNMIRLGINPSGTSLTNSCQITGILKANIYDENFYFNSIFIGGNNVSSNAANTYCFRRTTIGSDILYNNILYNARTNASSGGKHYAIGLNTASSILSNYNIMLTQTYPFGVVSGTDYNSLYTYRAATLLDTNSGSVNPNFVNPTGNYTSVDLHVSGITPVESNGYLIPAVTTDFDGQNRSSFTPVDIGADAGNFTWTVLPVSWLSFDAVWDNHKENAFLTWSTSSEKNTAAFDIERSNDGLSFEALAKITAAGNSSVVQQYEYTDKSISISTSMFPVYYYRIKETDKDGSISYSEVKAIQRNNNTSSVLINVFPNPYSDRLTLFVESANEGNAQIAITDLSGKLILENNISLAKGRQYLNIEDAPNLKAGIYFMKIWIDETMNNFKLIKTQ